MVLYLKYFLVFYPALFAVAQSYPDPIPDALLDENLGPFVNEEEIGTTMIRRTFHGHRGTRNDARSRFHDHFPVVVGKHKGGHRNIQQ